MKSYPTSIESNDDLVQVLYCASIEEDVNRVKLALGRLKKFPISNNNARIILGEAIRLECNSIVGLLVSNQRFNEALSEDLNELFEVTCRVGEQDIIYELISNINFHHESIKNGIQILIERNKQHIIKSIYDLLPIEIKREVYNKFMENIC